MSPRAARPRRERTATESLLSIVLVLEAIVLFFATLVVFGTRALDPVTAFVGGAVGIVLMLLVSRVLRFPWGMALGWVLQAGLVALGLLEPFMFVIGLGFAGIWIFCFVKGQQLERDKRAYRDGV